MLDSRFDPALELDAVRLKLLDVKVGLDQITSGMTTDVNTMARDILIHQTKIILHVQDTINALSNFMYHADRLVDDPMYHRTKGGQFIRVKGDPV